MWIINSLLTRFEFGIISIAGVAFDFGCTQFNISWRKFFIWTSFKLAGSRHSNFGPSFTFFFTQSRKPEISQSQTIGLSDISLKSVNYSIVIQFWTIYITNNEYLQTTEMIQKSKCIAWYLSNHILA